MYSSLFHPIALPFWVAVIAFLGLHVLGRLFLLSSYRRTRYLYIGTPWLPLRSVSSPLSGEEVSFSSSGKLTLRGTFLAHRAEQGKGTIVFCHELNGNRSNIGPYVDNLTEAGFNVLAFDFRNHGESDSASHSLPTPWITTADLDDVKAAIRYLETRDDLGDGGIGVFGLGKGATVALCVAGCDSRIRSIVLDAPMPENRLFDKNCWEVLVKSVRLSRRSTSRFVSLLFRAVLYSLTCPLVSLVHAWRRFMLGLWYGCRFVNPWPLVKRVRQPIMIVHGHADSKTRSDQIQAFCDRMPVRPRLWLISAGDREGWGRVSDDCCRQVARFFAETN